MFQWRKVITLLICSALLCGGPLMTAGEAAIAEGGVERSGFSDVNGHWAESEIEEFAKTGIIRGFPDGTFRPDEMVTQEQFMAMLQRLLPPIAGRQFDSFTQGLYLKDVKGRWSEAAYTNLLAAGIIPYGKPAAPIDRLLASRLMLTALAGGSEGDKYRETKALLFKDIDVSQEYEVITVYPLYKWGVVAGFPDGTFRPAERVTRAQAAVMLKRVQTKINEIYPDNVEDSKKQAMISTIKQIIEQIDNKNLERFDDLVRYVTDKNLPVSKAFLEEHYSFMNPKAVEWVEFPQFNELVYVSKIGTDKYRITVQYYSGEVLCSIDKSFYLDTKDGKVIRLIGRNE